MDQLVVDISHHNKRVDWDAVKASGAHVIIRCGYGQDEPGQDDKQWERNIAEAERTGVPHGVYFYSYAKSTSAIKGEIDHCLRLIRGHELQYPVYFDAEQPGTEAHSCECANAFCDAMEKAGYWAGVYASDSWFRSYMGGLGNYTKWVARYSSNAPRTACDMWQYTSTGAADGVPSTGEGVDLNHCYRDFPAEIGGGSSTAAQPAAEPAPEPAQPFGPIAEVQSWLGCSADNIYGPDTKRHLVKTLQHELNIQCGAGIAEDGIWGPRTRAACINVRRGASGNITRVLQGALICHGYSTNGFDGIFGGGTESAVRSYQRDHGLSVDGIAGKGTFGSLLG